MASPFEINALVAEQAFHDGDFEKCLEHIGASGSLRRGLAKYEAEASYWIAEKYCAESRYSDAEYLFERVLELGSHTPSNILEATEQQLRWIRSKKNGLPPE